VKRREFISLVGGAAVWPALARAQQAMPVIGVLHAQPPGPAMTGRLTAFSKGLAESNYVEGQNVIFESRWAENHYERLPELAADLVRRKVAVIAATTQVASLAAKAATATIPIVFNSGGDPVKFGLVASMNRPGGNATGSSMFSAQLEAKRFALLHELVPKATTVGILINPSSPNAENSLNEVQDAARSFGLQLVVRNMSSEGEFDSVFDDLAKAGAQALFAAADPFFSGRRERLVSLAAKHGLPAAWEWPDFVEGGGLMSYGTSIVDSYRQVGEYTGRILKGENPAEMPVMQPVKFELAINLKAAQMLGIEVPPTLLARADQVVE
jgi:putative ABC transport system substrate-binding protein